MKKYLSIILIFLCSIIFAQESYKGKISFVFNGEKIELPINTVMIRKADNIIISVRASTNTEKVQQNINLEWEMKSLSTQDSTLNLYNNFRLAVVNNKGDKRDQLNFSMKNNAKDGNLFVRKGYRTWQLTSFAMKFNIEDISFENSHIIIKGNLSLKARDKNSKTPLEPISEIKDCTFEVII